MTEKETEKKGKVRIAEEKDLSAVVKLLMEIPYDSGLFFPETDVVKVSLLVYEIYKRLPIFVYEKEGELVGVFFFSETSHWWSSEKFYTELGMFVKKEHRQPYVFKGLLDKVTEFAERNKTPLIITIFSANKLDTKEKMLERKGFVKVGSYHGIGF